MFGALATLLAIAVGVTIFQLAVLSTLESDNPWIGALPALVPFIGFVGVLFASLKEESWHLDLARNSLAYFRRHLTVMAVAAVALTALAGLLSWHVWGLASAKGGLFVVQVVRENDVPEDSVEGMPVVIEQKLSSDPPIEKETEPDGRARFEVSPDDVFTVRLRKSAEPNAAVFVVESSARIEAGSTSGFKLVSLSTIPDDAWIRSGAAEQSESFAQMPAEFFQWHAETRDGNVVSEALNLLPAFPFDLPPAETVVVRAEFTVGFSPLLRLPRWVAYAVVPGEELARSDAQFLPDPLLPASYQTTTRDFRGNDFDRGHLVTRRDLFGFGNESAHKINFLSAVVPQLGYVNRQTWLEVERETSQKASADGVKAYVLRGPILAPAPGQELVDVTLMGPNQIPIPTHFFQILRVDRETGSEVSAHLVPNAYAALDERGIAAFESSVADIARLTGLPLEQSFGQ